jgi:hypothetical protein
MYDLLIKPSNRTPEIKLLASKNTINISGKSTLENSQEFWNPIIDWIKKYLNTNPKSIQVIVDLEYFNTSSSKCILDVFRLFRDYHNINKCVTIKWYYEEDDEDMHYAGEDYETILKMPIQLISKM